MQTVAPLNPEDQKELEDRIGRVACFLAAEYSVFRESSHSQWLKAIQSAIDDCLWDDDVVWWQSLGLLFGEELLKRNRLEWVMVDDESGRDFALRLPKTSVLLFPLTMISKRIESNEPIDIEDLRNWAEEQLDRKRGWLQKLFS
jgi:hypothetical protein